MAKTKKAADHLFDMPDVSALREKLRGVDDEFNAQIKALEEKRKEKRDSEISFLKQQRGTLAQQRNECDIAISKIDKLIANLTGRDVTVVASGGARLRMSPDEQQKKKDQALAYLNAHAGIDGVARSVIAEHLALQPQQAAGILKELAADKKAESRGAKSNSRWFAK
jgi:hypothetical protein